MSATKHFRVVRKDQYFRLVHLPSGDYIQRYLNDFMTRKDAIACRDAIISAAPEWDWADSGLFTDMPLSVSDKVWAAIYGRPIYSSIVKVYSRRVGQPMRKI